MVHGLSVDVSSEEEKGFLVVDRRRLNLFAHFCNIILNTSFLFLAGSLVSQALPKNVFNVKLRAKACRSAPLPQPKAVSIPLERTAPTWNSSEETINEKDAWVCNLDHDAFAQEVGDRGKKLTKESNEDDVDHLNKILNWRDMATPNPITIIVALTTSWTYALWTMITPYTCHGGYNRVDAGKYKSRGFALGSVPRRVADWCDWMLPEAWNIEHNRLHHYHLGEPQELIRPTVPSISVTFPILLLISHHSDCHDL
eukprot:scaffold472_cov213-Chaetoceros_neogracile.AAC.7